MKAVVLVVRARDRFSFVLNENGFETINLPLIKTVRVADLTEFERKIADIDRYDGVFLTSPAAADVFLEKLGGKTFAGKIYVLGGRIRRMFEKPGVETVYREEANTIAEFLKSFPAEEFAGKRFLFPRGNLSRRAIPLNLAEAEIEETIVYETIKPPADENLLNEIRKLLSRDKITAACFFSPSGIENFLETFENFEQKNVKIAAIGATTARAAESNNLTVAFISPKSDAETFALELAAFLKNID